LIRNTLIKSILSLVLKPLANRYLSKDRYYRFDNIKIRIKSGIFHPGLFFSTKILIKWLKNQDVIGKHLLELGAGSGLISFIAVQNGAMVTASDISPKVIENLEFNMNKNQLKLKSVLSDLFDHIPENQYFDFILINPPYYSKAPISDDERAWFCGVEFEYFTKLFSQLRMRNFGKAILILSEDCEIDTIHKLGLKAGIEMKLEKSEKVLWEWNHIFELSRML